MTTFADDSANLSTGHKDLDGQSNVFGAGDVSLLPHLLKDQVLGLPLRFRRADDGDFPLSLLLSRLILLEGSDLHARAGEPDYVTDVRALGADDGADAVVGNVEESRLLGITGGDALLSRQAALVGIRGGSRTIEAGSTGAVAHTGGGHHGHRMQAGEHHALRSHSLQIVFVALAELAGDHGLGLAHVVDRSLNCDDAFEIEAIDVVDTADGDLCIGVLHDSFDRITALTDDPTDEIIVREDLQGDLTLVRVVGFLLHDFQDLLAGVGTVLRVAIDGDGFLQGTDVVLTVHVDSGTRHLRDLPYGGTLSTDYRAHHIGLYENAQWEIGLATGTWQPGESHAAATLAAAPASALRRGHLHFQRITVEIVAI